MQCILALGAIANVVTTASEIGRKAILAWGCTLEYPPLLWALSPMIVHLTAAAGQRVCFPSWPAPPKSEHEVSTGLSSWTRTELIISSNGQQDLSLTPAAAGFRRHIGEFLSVAAVFMSFIHLIFGTLVFASLLLVSTRDFFRFILFRLVASVGVCRLILLFEIGGMRGRALGATLRHPERAKTL